MYEKIKLIEGKQTLETISKRLNLTKNSAANLVSKLKKQGYLKRSGGGKQPRIYTISLKTSTQLKDGMFDILNKYSPIKLIPPFIHKVRGNYRIEDAIIDLIRLNNIRVLAGVTYLFNKIADWAYLRKKAIGIEARLGALYDFTRTIRKTKKMPNNIKSAMLKKRPKEIDYWIIKKDPNSIEKKWNTTVPLRGEDFDK